MIAARHQLLVITPREASIFACAIDTLLAPEPDLPPVHATTAVANFDDWMAASPAVNRFAVRGGLYVLELAPRLSGRGARFRRLEPAARRDFLFPARRRPAWQAALTDTLRMLAAAVYYGDDDVALQLGYDAEARLERGRALRAAEGRP